VSVRSLSNGLTPAGRSVFVAGPVAIGVGLLAAWAEVFALGIGCLLAVGLALLWVSRAQPVNVQRFLSPNRVTVGESAIGVVRVANAGQRRSRSREAEDVLGDRVVRLRIPSMSPGESTDTPYVVPTTRRGLFDVGPIRLHRSDLLGLMSVNEGQGSVEQLWVHPRVVELPPVASGWARDLDGVTSDHAPRGSAAFHTLRPYQAGDDLRHVHWRTTARRNQLTVRQYVDTRRANDMVILDTRAGIAADVDFESAVEVAASIVVTAERAGRSLDFAIPGESNRFARMPALDRCAVAEKVNLDARQLLVPLRQRAQGASALFLVTGQPNCDELIELARHLMRHGRVTVISLTTGTPSTRHQRPGVTLIEASDLDGVASVWAGGPR
jgi:uncharacterized protein (DUF58 family)